MQNYIKTALFALWALFVVSDVGFATSRTRTDEIVSSDGGAVVFPAGFTAPTANGEVLASTASLTLVASTNVAAVVTPVVLNYYRIGNTACAYGQVSIDPTNSATASIFTLTLPVTRAANFSGTAGATGFAGILGAAVGSCLATNAAKTVTCNYVSGGTAVELVPVAFCHSVTGN
jgi:hypothetical protein